MSSSDGEQLVSFFAHSLFIYPVTSWLASPNRGYSRIKGAIYAGLFLLIVSSLHLMYENNEKGPNHYQVLRVTRSSSVGVIKKAYRSLSLELHPDKNKSPTASDDFNRVKHSFDIITDREKRREYDRLGDNGVNVSKNTVIDHKYIIIQMIIYYCTSVIFAFMMTFTEPSGDAMMQSLFGLLTMFLIESLLVLHEAALPIWFFPSQPPSAIISALHRLFPAYINGCRSILGAFYVDRRKIRSEALESILEQQRELAVQAQFLVRATPPFAHVDDPSNILLGEGGEGVGEGEGEGNSPISSEGNSSSSSVQRDSGGVTMARMLGTVKNRYIASKEGKSGELEEMMKNKTSIISDSNKLQRSNKQGGLSPEMVWVRDIAIYIAARFIFIKKGIGG